MIFSEIYGEYFNAVAKILDTAVRGELNENDIIFLKDVFKDRLVVYPRGGHCGNMFYKENVDVMLKFVNEGVLKYEN